MSTDSTGFGENYIGQEIVSDDYELGEMSKDLYDQWQTARKSGLNDELAARLIRRANRGSIMAANMLHLSNADWDNLVCGEPYEYQQATYHRDTYSKGMRVQYAGGKERDDS